jgi:hypothetical protein
MLSDALMLALMTAALAALLGMVWVCDRLSR